MIKWVFAFLGYVILRFPGVVLGYIIGGALDSLLPKSSSKYMTRQKVSPADFELNLLSLCSIVIKADGGASKPEMDYVREYFVRIYGKDKANTIFRTFNTINKKHISVQPICAFLRRRTRYEVRLQLLHFLFGIAQADGDVSSREAYKIHEIADYLEVSPPDFESIKAMFVKSANTAYTILEIDKYATDDEVKKAYRKMAKKYHPDRVNTKNEAIKRGAEEKFKKVQIAYETIQKERGI